MKFKIDFFELAFLAESCVPPRPIARTMFWRDLIDKHYQYMSENERERLYHWIIRLDSFQDGIDKENVDCLMFEARYDPCNQYEVETVIENRIKKWDCFKFNGRHHLNSTTSICEENILNIKNK